MMALHQLTQNWQHEDSNNTNSALEDNAYRKTDLLISFYGDTS